MISTRAVSRLVTNFSTKNGAEPMHLSTARGGWAVLPLAFSFRIAKPISANCPEGMLGPAWNQQPVLADNHHEPSPTITNQKILPKPCPILLWLVNRADFSRLNSSGWTMSILHGLTNLKHRLILGSQSRYPGQLYCNYTKGWLLMVSYAVMVHDGKVLPAENSHENSHENSQNSTKRIPRLMDSCTNCPPQRFCSTAGWVIEV